MGVIATQADNLSKQYKIGVVNQRYDELRNRLTDGLKGLFRRHVRLSPPNNIIWALKDVSF
jgi:hypothetical protein